MKKKKVTVDVEFNEHWTDTITHWKQLDKRAETQAAIDSRRRSDNGVISPTELH